MPVCVCVWCGMNDAVGDACAHTHTHTHRHMQTYVCTYVYKPRIPDLMLAVALEADVVVHLWMHQLLTHTRQQRAQERGRQPRQHVLTSTMPYGPHHVELSQVHVLVCAGVCTLISITAQLAPAAATLQVVERVVEGSGPSHLTHYCTSA